MARSCVAGISHVSHLLCAVSIPEWITAPREHKLTTPVQDDVAVQAAKRARTTALSPNALLGEQLCGLSKAATEAGTVTINRIVDGVLLDMIGRIRSVADAAGCSKVQAELDQIAGEVAEGVMPRELARSAKELETELGSLDPLAQFGEFKMVTVVVNGVEAVAWVRDINKVASALYSKPCCKVGDTFLDTAPKWTGTIDSHPAARNFREAEHLVDRDKPGCRLGALILWSDATLMAKNQGSKLYPILARLGNCGSAAPSSPPPVTAPSPPCTPATICITCLAMLSLLPALPIPE